ncbi:ribosomal protein L37AE/L43A [Rhodopirellula rubra]|uniref:Ribosomal protein L37AE/L43A n=1 Tax=Aporhodopirellula rubra TaxID=980271 RepID=A0A7W5DZ86_9BACT|nr:response regulator [Aporhodopirellula rubra]MBB3207240.1 ribosomal protein L37AE/L43A [Aporhodopirellula rubra]
MSIKFTQSCPTCGRRIDIRASLLGCTVACQHCGAEFTANANEESRMGPERNQDLLDRVEKALRRAEEASMVPANAEIAP